MSISAIPSRAWIRARLLRPGGGSCGLDDGWCGGFAGDWAWLKLDAGHWPMRTAPQELAALLAKA